MRVICCYTHLHPKTLEALAACAPDTTFIDTSSDIYAYNRAVEKYWGHGDLVVIEEDKVVTPEVISSFASCDQPWCSYSYFVYPRPYRQRVSYGLGCARFSAEVQRQVPVESFLYDDSRAKKLLVAGECPLCNGKGCWKYLDSRIACQMWDRSISVHVHGQVEHLHEYKDQPMWDQIMSLGNSLAGPYWGQ